MLCCIAIIVCFDHSETDESSLTGYDFVFIAFSPDFAHVREKMLYASTRSTLKLAFGTNYIIDELFGTVAVCCFY